ncbi:ribonuclease J [Clostridiaceae bacterium HSG29]|nr:ribonuclease J [Clostridiaceae bacterium HSG29]
MQKKNKLKIIPLGGLEEIGKNMTVFEYEDDIVLLDAGFGFPDDELLGIDIVIPDITYLEKNSDKVKGIIITHGHMDHIGSLPFVLQKVNVPIYGTKLTLGLVKVRLEEYKDSIGEVELIEIDADTKFELGSFKIDPIRVSHSIPDSVGFAITTPVGVVIHTGDFKIDYTPIDGDMIDLAKFAKYGSEGVMLLMADSTNVMRKGSSMSEMTVGKTFDEIFMNTDERIVVASFSSNVHRIQQIVNAAHVSGRKVAFSGRSMFTVTEVAIDLGYLKMPEDILIDVHDIDKYPDNEIVLVTTGSQGEPMSALYRMANSFHKNFELRNGDLVILSSTPIPGNEKPIIEIINLLHKKGVNVIYQSLADVHVSGHACEEELKVIHSLVKPKFFMPVHGEYSHLLTHVELAQKLGMSSNNTFLLTNGNVLELNDDEASITGKVQSGRIFVDGIGVGDVGNVVIRDRRILSQDGLMVVVLHLDTDNLEVTAMPDIISRGFVYVRESESLIASARNLVKQEALNSMKAGKTDWNDIKKHVVTKLNEFLYKKTRRRPMILPIVIDK